MLKVIYFGTNSPDNQLNQIRRNSKLYALALTIEIDVISERLEDLNSQAAVTFSITETPIEVAAKVIADTAEGQPAVVVLEYGKPVAGDVKDRVAEFIARCVRPMTVS